MEHFKIKTECGVCSTKIWHYDGIKLKKTAEYNEVLVKLNNLSKMKVGVCNKHIKPKQKELKIMTQRMHQGWLEEVTLGIGNKEWIMEVGSKLQIVGVA